MQITAPLIVKLCPQATPAIIAALVGHDDVFSKRGMTSPIELCGFLAQGAVETWHLTAMVENLSYSGARLWALFGTHHFKSVEEADAIAAAGAAAIANRIYGGRMGNVHAGDGYLFRGRGLLDLTGRDSYTRVGAVTGLDLIGNPDLAMDPAHALDVACGFWAWKGISPAAKAGNTVAVTRLVQGGTGDLAARQQYFARAKAIFIQG